MTQQTLKAFLQEMNCCTTYNWYNAQYYLNATLKCKSVWFKTFMPRYNSTYNQVVMIGAGGPLPKCGIITCTKKYSTVVTALTDAWFMIKYSSLHSNRMVYLGALTKSDYNLHHVSLFVGLSAMPPIRTTPIPLDWCSRNLNIEDSLKICPEYSNFI